MAEQTWTLVAETKEFVGPINVTVDGTPTTNFEVAVTVGGGRPTTWVPADVIEGERGVLVGSATPFPLQQGQKYTIWTRFTDSPEIPVDRAGFIKVI
jgi:hypothetical protein